MHGAAASLQTQVDHFDLDVPILLWIFLCPAAYKGDVAIQAKSIREFDDAITRVSFGWPDGETFLGAAGAGSVGL